jgi:FtsP/CotA-like multicopper oxidase with cupredoxin domain
MQRKQETVRQIKSKGALATVLLSLAALSQLLALPALALDNIGDMAQEQAQEKLELEDMRNEMKDIKGQVRDAMGAMSELTNQGQALPNSGPQQVNVREIHLFAREANLEVGAESGANKATIKALTYNGKIPGPEIHVRQGEAVRIVLAQQPQKPCLIYIATLPRPDSLLTKWMGFREQVVQLQPQSDFSRQTILSSINLLPTQTGTFFYHPANHPSRSALSKACLEPLLCIHAYPQKKQTKSLFYF